MAELKPDLSEFLAISRASRPDKCRLGDLVEQVKGEQDRINLLGAIEAVPWRTDEGVRVTHGSIVTWLLERGMNVSGDTVKKHRERKCRCFNTYV